MHVLYSFPNRVGVTGIGSIAWHHVNQLTKQGIKVSLFCGSCEKDIPGVYRVVETMKIGGLKIPYRMVGNHRASLLHDFYTSRSLKLINNKIDVIHCWPLGSLATLAGARRFAIRSFIERPNTHTGFAYDVVANEHDRIGLPMPSHYTHRFNAKNLAREEAEYASADYLLCPSPFVARSFLDRGLPANKLALHQYGYEPTQSSDEGDDDNRGDREFTIAFVGRCEPRKGLHYALEAWHKSKAAERGRFIICGSFMDGYRELLNKWIDHPSVTVMGFVPKVRQVMHNADVLVLPTIEEGSALVTYEARGEGCVLLVSSAAGAVCTHEYDSLVHDPSDVDTLANHLTDLSGNTSKLNNLRRHSLIGLGALTWEHAVRRLIECYKGEHVLQADSSA